jgi:hypothetical protein
VGGNPSISRVERGGVLVAGRERLRLAFQAREGHGGWWEGCCGQWEGGGGQWEGGGGQWEGGGDWGMVVVVSCGGHGLWRSWLVAVVVVITACGSSMVMVTR